MLNLPKRCRRHSLLNKSLRYRKKPVLFVPSRPCLTLKQITPPNLFSFGMITLPLVVPLASTLPQKRTLLLNTVSAWDNTLADNWEGKRARLSVKSRALVFLACAGGTRATSGSSAVEQCCCQYRHKFKAEKDSQKRLCFYCEKVLLIVKQSYCWKENIKTVS